MPTYNRREKLEKCLDSLERLDFPEDEYEVVVVNDGSEDSTKKFLDDKKDDMEVLKVVHHEENQGIAPTRNTALEQAEAEEFLFFTDDDCIVPEDWVKRHLEHYDNDSEIYGVNGVQWPVDLNLVEAFKLARHYDRYEGVKVFDGEISTGYGETNNLSYRREVVEEVGDFNNGLERGSDTEYGRRVLEEGYKCVLDPSIKVKHLKSDSILSFLKTKYKLGVSIKKQTDATEKIEEDRDTTDSTHILEAWKYYNSKVRFFEKPLFPFIGFLSVASRKIGERGGI